MMNQILFVSDIDGTLLKTGQMPRLSVLRAIARFQEEGGEFCLCTGRALPAVREGEIQKGEQRRKKQKRVKLQMLQQKRKHARQRQSLSGQKREKPLPEHMKKKRQNQSQYK